MNSAICHSVVLKPLCQAQLLSAVALDKLALGGFWSADGYQQELNRNSSDLLGLWPFCSQSSSRTSRMSELGTATPKWMPEAQPQPVLPSDLFAVGCTWTILDETHLVLIAVHPEQRQCGFGSAMLLGLLESALVRGSHYATLEVRPSNQAAIGLYQKFGFNAIGRRPNYYQDAQTGATEDALIFWRSGLQSPEFLTTINRLQNQVRQQLHQHHWQLTSMLKP